MPEGSWTSAQQLMGRMCTSLCQEQRSGVPAATGNLAWCPGTMGICQVALRRWPLWVIFFFYSNTARWVHWFTQWIGLMHLPCVEINGLYLMVMIMQIWYSIWFLHFIIVLSPWPGEGLEDVKRIQQLFSELWLCARPLCRHWGYSKELAQWDRLLRNGSKNG